MCDQTIIDLPPNFRTRSATMTDNAEVVRLFNANLLSTIGEAVTEADEFTRRWSEASFDIEYSTQVILAPTGEIVAYTGVHDTMIPPVNPTIHGCVHPKYEGLGLGSAMLEWGIVRAKQAIPRCPEQARIAAQIAIRGEHEAAIQLFKAYGFELSRRWWTMQIKHPNELSEPTLPVGITIRPANFPDELEQLVRINDLAFQDHYGHVDRPFDKLLAKWRQWIETDKEFDPELWFIAVDDVNGEMVGLCLCRHTINGKPERALINSLGVIPAYRNRGLGLALLQTGFSALWAREKQEVILGVDATSLTGATRLYEKAGMSHYRTDCSFEKELRPGEELRRTS